MIEINDEQFSHIDKDTYMRAMVVLAHIDGVHEKEIQYLSTQAELIGISLDGYFENQDKIENIDFSQVSNKMKKTIIRDLIVLSYIDDNYSDTEKEHLNKVSHDMGLQPNIVDRMEKWLIDYWNILEEGKNIFEM